MWHVDYGVIMPDDPRISQSRNVRSAASTGQASSSWEGGHDPVPDGAGEAAPMPDDDSEVEAIIDMTGRMDLDIDAEEAVNATPPEPPAHEPDVVNDTPPDPPENDPEIPNQAEEENPNERRVLYHGRQFNSDEAGDGPCESRTGRFEVVTVCFECGHQQRTMRRCSSCEGPLRVNWSNPLTEVVIISPRITSTFSNTTLHRSSSERRARQREINVQRAPQALNTTPHDEDSSWVMPDVVD